MQALAASVIIEACLGVILAWPTILTERVSSAHLDVSVQLRWIHSLTLVAFAMSAVAAGKLLDRINPGLCVRAGGVALGVGIAAAGLTGKISVMGLGFAGIVAGSGAGFAYLVPVVLAVRLFPSEKGLASGLVAAGFLSGVVIWSRTAAYLVDVHLLSWSAVHILLGLTVSVCCLAGSFFVTYSGSDPRDEEWHALSDNFTRPQYMPGGIENILASYTFYAILIVFFVSAFSGHIASGIIQPYGIESLRARGLENKIAMSVSALAALLFQLASMVGPPAWGLISDRMDRRWVLAVLCGIQGMVLLLMTYTVGSPQSVILFACLTGFNYGGNLGLFPAVTDEIFDDRSLTWVYSLIFLAFIAAGVAGPETTGYFLNEARTGEASFGKTPLVVLAAACLGASLLALFFKSK
jgi:OFA family oxalate/formate antiporter-like MFS transporter